MKLFFTGHRKIIRDTIRGYFAPLIGAYKAVRSEWRRTEREIIKQSSNTNHHHA